MKIKAGGTGSGMGKQGKLPKHENVNTNKKGPVKMVPHGSQARSPLNQPGGKDGHHGCGGGR